LCKEIQTQEQEPLPSLELQSDREKSDVSTFLNILSTAVHLRVENIPKRTNHAKVAILFSGGLDCTAIAALLNSLLPIDEPVDLLNVAFENRKANSKAIYDYDNVPDRKTGLSSWRQLETVFPNRQWNFVQINVTREEYMQMKPRIVSLMKPLNSIMDLSIAIALWFAARGQGVERTSHARVLLSGLGADEQLGGYSRHAAQFQKNGLSGLLKELEWDLEQLPFRNLGRDDRVISDIGKEIRFPFLDENVIQFLSGLPVQRKMDLRLSRGIGDKMLLRKCVNSLGLTQTAMEPKRAIQFGAKTAKMEGNEKGHISLDFAPTQVV